MKDNLEVREAGGGVEEKQKLEITKPLQLTAIALILGFAFEILFFDHRIGISFFILSTACGIGLLASSYLEGHRPRLRNAIFFLPILFFSFMTYFRAEPLTVFLDVIGTLILFTLWVRDFRLKRIFDYGFIELLVSLIYVLVESWIKPWKVLGETQRKVFKEGERRSVVLGVLRGLILALPILVVLLGLLTSADLVFADRVRDALDWLDLERIAEYGGRTLFVIVGTIFFLGAIVAALQDPAGRKLIGEEKPILKPFLGFIESIVISGLVDLLFASFLFIQFRYLFGGVANINAAGYTFSDYARRGFFELVAVGILSSGLILGLTWWGRRESQGRRRWFNALSTLLVIQVGLILYSSLTRLLLYENEYGFTRLRTYTHIFIPWMALVLAAFVILLLLKKLNRIPIAVALGVIGFVGTLNLLNVDEFIVNQNVARLEERYEIDYDYLVTLSEDAVPLLFQLTDEVSDDEQDNFLGQLACWSAQLEKQLEDDSWSSAHRSFERAGTFFDELSEEFKPYEITGERGLWQIEYEGEFIGCYHQSWMRGFD
jgi:hypothetical protein